MIAAMTSSGRRLSLEDLTGLESRYGLRLPDDYARFLLEYNGGCPAPNAFPIQGLAGNPFGAIQMFFGIDRKSVSSNIEWNYDLFVGDGIRDLLPIACTGCGDCVCLTLSGEGAGSVVFWDAHTDAETPRSARVFCIAPSFATFLDCLFEPPRDK
jgi:hypothetical protein